MNNFEIRAPKWSYVLFVGMLCLGIALIIAGIALQLAKVNETIFALAIMGAFFAILSLLGIYAYKKESFILEGGVYTYNKVFKKSQSAHVHEISHIEVTVGSGMFMNVVFYGKDGSKLINFLDDGTAFKDGIFEKSLEAYNIPLNFNY